MDPHAPGAGSNPFAPAVSAAALPLLMEGRKQSTRRVYREAVRAFAVWVAEHKAQAFDASGTDHVLARYIQRCFDSGSGGVDRAKATMYGLIMLYPLLRRRLPLSAGLLTGWRRARPGRPYPPMTWPVACAVALAMVSFGEPRLAAGTVLSFHCLLRAREMLALRSSDIVDGRDLRLDPRTARTEVVIRDAKGGRNQCVHVSDPDVLALLREVLDATPADGLLFGGASQYGRYYRLWRRAISALRLDPSFVPHSLRHGGATAAFMAGVPIADIKVLGRWARLETAQHYVQTARALLGSVAVPSAVSSVGRVAATGIARAFALTQSHFVAGGEAAASAAVPAAIRVRR